MSGQRFNKKSSHWVESGGGPLLLLDESKLMTWGGVIDPLPPCKGEARTIVTDYDRACSVDGYLGKIRVDNGEALVLGDESCPTIWIPSAMDDGGVFVRWRYADSEPQLLRTLDNMPDRLFQFDVLFGVTGRKLILFDSALAGRNVAKYPDAYQQLELNDGVYEVATGVYEDERTGVVVHRLFPKHVR